RCAADSVPRHGCAASKEISTRAPCSSPLGFTSYQLRTVTASLSYRKTWRIGSGRAMRSVGIVRGALVSQTLARREVFLGPHHVCAVAPAREELCPVYVRARKT